MVHDLRRHEHAAGKRHYGDEPLAACRNDYGGGTTVSAGTLQGSTTSLQGDITDNAVLQFSQDLAGTYGGTLSGSGNVVKNGSGALILSGDNSGFTGNTIVNGGTIGISADANLGTGGTLELGNGTGVAFTAGGT